MPHWLKRLHQSYAPKTAEVSKQPQLLCTDLKPIIAHSFITFEKIASFFEIIYHTF